QVRRDLRVGRAPVRRRGHRRRIRSGERGHRNLRQVHRPASRAGHRRKRPDARGRLVTRPQQVWPIEFAAEYRRKGYWTGETIGGMLRRTATRLPGHDAVVFEHGRWSYADLDERADRLAGAFRDLGFAPGDRVLVQLPNVPEFIAVVFGLFRADVLPVFVLPAHRRTEIEHFARASGAVGYVIPATFGGFDSRSIARGVRPALP